MLSLVISAYFHVILLLASEGVCETISASQNTPLGDKGNPQVSEELDKLGNLSINQPSIKSID